MGSLTAPWPKAPRLHQEGLMAEGHREGEQATATAHCPAPGMSSKGPDTGHPSWFPDPGGDPNPGAPQDEAGLTRKFETSHVGGASLLNPRPRTLV